MLLLSSRVQQKRSSRGTVRVQGQLGSWQPDWPLDALVCPHVALTTPRRARLAFCQGRTEPWLALGAYNSVPRTESPNSASGPCPSPAEWTLLIGRVMQPIGAKEDWPILPLTPPDFLSLDKPCQPASCHALSREIDCAGVLGDIGRACVMEKCIRNPASRIDALAVYEGGTPSRLPEENLETAERNPQACWTGTKHVALAAGHGHTRCHRERGST